MNKASLNRESSDRMVVLSLLSCAYLIGVVGLIWEYGIIEAFLTLFGLGGAFLLLLTIVWGALAMGEYALAKLSKLL